MFMLTIDKHLLYFNLLDALKEEGCAICHLLKGAVHKLMDDLLYEQVNDPGVRSKIRESLGFCSLHAWQLKKFGDPLGAAIIYNDLLQMVVADIERRAMSEKRRAKILGKKILTIVNKVDGRKNVTCPICKLREEAETRYVSTFIESVTESDFLSSYKNSFGLCLPHLGKVINSCRQKETIRSILNIESAKMKELICELKEIQRKHDYLFSHEGFGKERDAWIRAIEKVVGKEGVFG